MKYKDSLYIIFILHEQGVTNLTNLIETLPETGRDKNILNNFIENIIYNNIDKKKFIKVLDILYEKHPANYIEIFEQAILENYENILKFIDTEDKPEYIKYIYEKYEKCLISNSNDIYYKKPSNENPFAKTPFISYEKIQSYYKKNETSEKKKIIKVGKNNQKYYFSYVKQTRQKPTSKWQPVDRIEYLEKVEDKNVFILNNNPEMIFINFAELENDEKYNKVKNVSKLKEKFKNLLYEPLEVEEYKFKDEISDPYQQKTDELNAEQPDNLTLALALGNAST